MENNKINPIGLKGNQINQRMIELMGIKPINENNTKSVVELTKIGPDGKTYGIVRENHDYYIKTSTKTSNLIVEDFNYIGGLQNKKSEAYPSYAKAIKHLNLNFKSLAEAYGKGGDINVFENDNLLTEDISGFSQYGGNGFSNEGNLEGNQALYTEEEEVEEVPENPEDYTKQPGYIHEDEIELSEVEQAVENMLEADDVKNPGKYMDGEKEELGIDDDGDGVPNGADKDPKDGDIMESTFSIARAMENIDSVIDSLTETVLKKKV